jgi:acyl carrier protein
MIKKLVPFIADILDVSSEEIESSKDFLGFEKFDSLAQIQIAAILDAEFGFTIEPEQFELLDSLDSIISLTNRE